MAIKTNELKEALTALEVSKGISQETIVLILKETLEKGFRKEIGFEDANVECVIDLENDIFSLSQIFTVVDDVEDDVLEIHIDDARKTEPNISLGDLYYVECDPETLKKATYNAVRSMFRQKMAESEKVALYEAFKDKINTLITGKVEKTESEKGIYVNVGKTSVFLPRSQMIGDETYKVGEPIKLFVSKVNNNTKGAQIQVTRASSDFLAALFKEEIQDVYDGTVEIKKIARYAGIRSKVAVSTNNLDMDPAGAIIGQGGNKITKVISNLGNGKIKEKIDVVAYSNIKEAFLMEALKPAKCLGVAIDEEENEADVIVPDDGYLLALGKTGINIKLVKILTGYNNIHVRTETEAREDEIEYLTKEEIDSMVAAEKANRKREAQATYLVNDTVSSLPGLPSDYVAPQDRVYEDEVEDEDISEALLEQSEKEIATPVLEETNVVEEETIEVKEEITSVVEEKVEVKTTTNIDDLEKSLEDSKSKGKGKSFSKRKKVAKKEEEETTETITPTVDPSTYMSIYTEEELAEMEEEENIDDYYEEDDIDYDEYDSYYDDDNN